jgi:hypothetical protein
MPHIKGEARLGVNSGRDTCLQEALIAIEKVKTRRNSNDNASQ